MDKSLRILAGGWQDVASSAFTRGHWTTSVAAAAIAGIVLTGRARVLALVGAARSFVLTGQDRGL